MQQIAAESSTIPVLIFKHSTRCGISRMALKGFESQYAIDAGQVKPYFLDLLNYREISNAIARDFGVHHESPQVLLIKDGKVVYHESHGAISATQIEKQL